MCGRVVVAASCVAFDFASAFNGDVSLWDTSSVTSMHGSKWFCVIVDGDWWKGEEDIVCLWRCRSVGIDGCCLNVWVHCCCFLCSI